MLPKADFQKLQLLFSHFDKKNQGTVSRKDFGEIMRMMSKNPTEKELDEMFKESGLPTDWGKINMTELLEHFILPEKKINKEGILNLLRSFDKSGSGTISKSDLKDVLSKKGEKMTEEQLDEVFRLFGQSDSNINYNDFLQ